MQIKRSIEKIPGGDDARPAIPWRTVPHLLAGGGKYFGSFTNGMITGTVPILAVWFLHGGVNKIKRDGNGIA